MPGPSQLPTDEQPLDATPWGEDDDFLRIQEVEPMLTKTREDLAVFDGHMLDVRQANRLP